MRGLVVNIPVLIAASIATLVAIMFAFFTRTAWTRKRPVFAPFPTRATAVLASLVALRGWLELMLRS